MPQDRIPEIIGEQQVADLLDREAVILTVAGFDADICEHPEAQIHFSGVAMASALETFLRSYHGQLGDTACADTRHGKHLLTLIDFTVQFRALHLDFLDRLNPA